MKIRELSLKRVRHFVEPVSLRFDDLTTGEVRPITVLTGSNGCGKTTVLEAIVSAIRCLSDAITLGFHDRWLAGATRDGSALQGTADAEIRAELNQAGGERGLWVVLSSQDPTLFQGTPTAPWISRGVRDGLSVWAGNMPEATWAAVVEDLAPGRAQRHGIIHFPHDRWYDQRQRGSIEAPSEDPSWIWSFRASDQWKGSLAQLWVWQNYLDLEQGREGRPNLAPFVEIIERILGQDRRVFIREGRVRIKSPGRPDVEPHELPSGEQQILTLFGELARRLRPGAIILIDEVEISLHPALQRKVMFHFRALARKYDLQFILTTHSPEILRSCRAEEIVDMDHLGENQVSMAAESTEIY